MNIGFLLGAAGVCLILIGIIGFVLMYNRLQRLSVKVDEAASGIDVALEKRWDLLNELLAAVKKYLTHEYETLTGVTALRSGTEAEKRRLEKRKPAFGSAGGRTPSARRSACFLLLSTGT